MKKCEGQSQRSNIYLIRVPEKKGETGEWSLFDEIISENLPELMKNPDLEILKSQWITSSVN